MRDVWRVALSGTCYHRSHILVRLGIVYTIIPLISMFLIALVALSARSFELFVTGLYVQLGIYIFGVSSGSLFLPWYGPATTRWFGFVLTPDNSCIELALDYFRPKYGINAALVVGDHVTELLLQSSVTHIQELLASAQQDLTNSESQLATDPKDTGFQIDFHGCNSRVKELEQDLRVARNICTYFKVSVEQPQPVSHDLVAAATVSISC